MGRVADIPARPIQRRVEAWIKSHSHPQLGKNGEVRMAGGETVFCEKMGWDLRSLTRLREATFITFELADRILARLGDTDLWQTDRALRRCYKRPIPVGKHERRFMDAEEREAWRKKQRAYEARRNKKRSTPVPQVESHCHHCGQPMKKRAGAKYCATSCRVKASRIRNGQRVPGRTRGPAKRRSAS